MIIEEKIHIGISACCYGAKVRYNNKGWDKLVNMGREKGQFIFHPLCPEVMAGGGVPRPPIRIAGGSGAEVWENAASIVQGNGKNITQQMKKGALVCLDSLGESDVTAFIYMDGSPSCGVYRTTLKNKRLGKPPGVFGAKLLEAGYFLIPAADLDSPLKWWDWRRRLWAFHYVKHLSIPDSKALYDLWHLIKFLCQELDEPWARSVGKRLANEKITSESIETLRGEVLEVLRKPSDVRRIKNRLWKHYSFHRKKDALVNELVKAPSELRNLHELAEELMSMEWQSAQKGLLFGSTPVIYR